MSDHGENTTPRASSKGGGPKKGDTKDGSTKDSGPKTPTGTEKGKKNITQIELTPVESLLFFNMVRFGSHEKIDWERVASYSNLKNAASARVRFRQILKKHDLMDQAPETPRSQAQKRKAASKSEESPDEDGDSSYNPSPVAPKTSVRKQSARTSGGRAKRQKVDVKTEDDQDDEEAAADSVVVASASAPKAAPDTKPNMKSEADTNTEIEAEAKTCANANSASNNFIDGTNSASPHEYTRDQAPQGLSAGAAHFMPPVHRHSALPASLGEAQMMQRQIRRPSMPHSMGDNDSIAYVQQLNPQQLAALQVPHTPRLQYQMTPEEREQQQNLMLQAQAQQFNRFENFQMFPHLGGMVMPSNGMPGDNLPFGHLAQMQLNEQFPAGIYNGGGHFFDQAQLGNDVDYGNADEEIRGRVDGQDEWDVESVNFKREATREAKEESDSEGERENGDDSKHRYEHKLNSEEN